VRLYSLAITCTRAGGGGLGAPGAATSPVGSPEPLELPAAGALAAAGEELAEVVEELGWAGPAEPAGCAGVRSERRWWCDLR
jgi:hypothetical protein